MITLRGFNRGTVLNLGVFLDIFGSLNLKCDFIWVHKAVLILLYGSLGTKGQKPMPHSTNLYSKDKHCSIYQQEPVLNIIKLPSE
jgi:hypothetical protein